MSKITRRAFAASSAAAAAVAGFGFKPALAQAYPARPVTVIVPWGAGGGTDATARIVAALGSGTPVTTPRFLADHVVTEYGVAALRGQSTAQRVRELIRVAHPAFREGLERAAIT